MSTGHHLVNGRYRSKPQWELLPNMDTAAKAHAVHGNIQQPVSQAHKYTSAQESRSMQQECACKHTGWKIARQPACHFSILPGIFHASGTTWNIVGHKGSCKVIFYTCKQCNMNISSNNSRTAQNALRDGGLCD